jgi:hypothetical protein
VIENCVTDKQYLYHIGDLVIFSYKDMVERIGLVEFVDEDFYGDTIYSIIDSESGKTLFIRQTYIIGLAYR